MHVLQLYKGEDSTWATGTNRSKDKPAILALQVMQAIPLCDTGKGAEPGTVLAAGS